jgi:uncharacterized protein GlcG (DUF336 family)
VITLAEPGAVISAEAAAAAVSAAIAKARELGVRINVAVVDSGGNLAAFLRTPGAFLHSIGIAQDKAYTAASFGFPTGEWGAVLAGDEDLRQGLMQVPRLRMIGGGYPIEADGVRLGGIGVSGASEEQDQICARAGLAALGLAQGEE